MVASARGGRNEKRSLLVVLAWVIGVGWVSGGEALVEEAVEFEGVTFRVVRVAPERVRLRWKGGDGKPLKTFGAVQDQLRKEGVEAALLLNGGIYEPRNIPSGLYVEGGTELNPLNLEDGKGNFFLKPNGVLLFREVEGKAKAAVWSSNAYAQWRKLSSRPALPSYAVQSGPLLLQRGMIHLKFLKDSKNRLPRNGVGVDSKGRVVFAITGKRQAINLHGFARLFREALDCREALFLDGVISEMVVNPTARVRSGRFASIIVVEK